MGGCLTLRIDNEKRLDASKGTHLLASLRQRQEKRCHGVKLFEESTLVAVADPFKTPCPVHKCYLMKIDQ